MEMKFFQFDVWSVFHNCLHEIPWNKTKRACYFIGAILTKFTCYVNTTTKWNHMKANIGACKYKGNILFELLLWNSNCNQKCLVSKKQNIDLSAALQIVAGHWSLPTIWVSWSVKIDADFLKWPNIINM